MRGVNKFNSVIKSIFVSLKRLEKVSILIESFTVSSSLPKSFVSRVNKFKVNQITMC